MYKSNIQYWPNLSSKIYKTIYFLKGNKIGVLEKRKFFFGYFELTLTHFFKVNYKKKNFLLLKRCAGTCVVCLRYAFNQCFFLTNFKYCLKNDKMNYFVKF